MSKVNVNGKVKHFAYTPAGMAAAKRAEKSKEDGEMKKAHNSAMKRVKKAGY